MKSLRLPLKTILKIGGGNPPLYVDSGICLEGNQHIDDVFMYNRARSSP